MRLLLGSRIPNMTRIPIAHACHKPFPVRGLLVDARLDHRDNAAPYRLGEIRPSVHEEREGGVGRPERVRFAGTNAGGVLVSSASPCVYSTFR